MSDGVKRVPELRLSGFEGEWVERPLREVVNRVTRKNTGIVSRLPLTISAQHGLVDQRTYFNSYVVGANVENYYLLHKGEFAYNKSSSAGYKAGTVKRLEKYDQGIVSTLYIAFSTAAGSAAEPGFLAHYFETEVWPSEVLKRAAEGARNHGLLNVSAEQFFDIPVVFPPTAEEQSAISGSIDQLDKLIESSAERIEALQHLRQTMLVKMFPRGDAREPEIRFNGFEREWDSFELKETAEIFIDGDWIESKDQSNVGFRLLQTGNIGTGRFLDKSDKARWISEDTFERLKCTEVLEGDILISRLPEPAGRGCVVPQLDYGSITAVDCTILRLRPQFDPSFVVWFMSSPVYFLKVNQMLAGGTRQRISRSNLASLPLRIPSIEEQRAIGAYFRNLDELIEAESTKVEKLRNLKSALLEKMFV